MAQVYGGDDIGALVLDTGAAWTRVGWAGDDVPSRTTPTWYANSATPSKYRFEDFALNSVRPNTDILNPLQDSVVADWDAMEEMWKHTLALYLSQGDSPMLVTEQLWNPEKNRLKTMEFCLESLGVPAMYLAKSAVCTLFASGRGSGIVVDAGAQTLSVTPVVDGLALYRASRRSRKAGYYLDARVSALLASRGDSIVTRFEVASKTPVGPGETPQFTRKPLINNVTPSFMDFQKLQVCSDFKESMVQVSDTPFKQPGSAKARCYEFPDGHSIELSGERLELGEDLFAGAEASNTPQESAGASKEIEEHIQEPDETGTDAGEESDSGEKAQTKKANPPTISFTLPEVPGFSDLGVSQLIADAINACDVDVRASMANNIVIAGGTSLLHGFTERISQDLIKQFPALKIRIYSSGNVTERRNAAWIGGSILGSLGTFHQMWVSQQEYSEVGGDQLIKKRFR